MEKIIMKREKLLKTYEICKKKIDKSMQVRGCDDTFEYVASKTGKYNEETPGVDLYHMYNWITSFSTGLAPLMYRTEKDEKYLIWANGFEKHYHSKIFEHSLDTMHDIGFLYSPYSVAMYQLTGAHEHREDAVKAADELMKRFDINGHYIDAWNRMDNDERGGRALVDCMINIQLLFWAWNETGHTVYRDIAKAHADTTAKYFLRDDDTIVHSMNFNRENGEVAEENNDCGYANGTHWARGTAWFVYGMAMTARYLNDESYYNFAKRAADKYIERLNGAFIPAWDFDLPADMPAFECGHKDNPEWDFTDPKNCVLNVDTSAAVIMVCALMEMNRFKMNKDYDEFVSDSLEKLCDDYFNTDPEVLGMISHQNGQMTYTMFGDYFFVQALQERLFNTQICW